MLGRSRRALFLEDLELGEPPAHLLLGARRRYHACDDGAELPLLSAAYLTQWEIRGTYQGTDASKPEHPGDAVLAIQRRVVRRVIINIGIDNMEDGTRDQRNLRRVIRKEDRWGVY